MRPASGHDAGYLAEAAMLGTATAAAIALMVGGEGAWELLHSLIGLSLLAVVIVYYERPAVPRRLRWELRTADGGVSPGARVVAAGAVLALCACLVLAYPLQPLVTRRGSAAGKRCADAELSASARNDCRGDAASEWMWTVWVAGVVVGGAWAARWPTRWNGDGRGSPGSHG